MTSKADFTEAEWEQVLSGPPMAGLIVAAADHGGMMRETFAMAKAYGEARKEHGESELLDALVAEKPDVKRYSSSDELESKGLSRLTEAVALLEQKATTGEVAGYRKFVMDVAEQVAEAHKEGGQEVSEGERAAIEKIAASLYPSGSA